MPFPPLVVTGAVIASSHINALRNALMVWPGDVDADGSMLYDASSLRVLAASGDIRIMEDANTGFRWLLNGDGTLRLQRTTNNYGAATQPIVVNADSSILIPGELSVGGALDAASADLTGGLGVGIVNSGAARLMVQASSAGGASGRFTDGVNSTIIFDHPSSGVARVQVPSGSLKIDGPIYFGTVLPGPYADNPAAVAAGLTAGRLYRDSSNNVKQVQ
jgi:hypothetical protein